MSTAKAVNEIDIAYLNGLSENEAHQALTKCCGAAAWVKQMLAKRPYTNSDSVHKLAGETWWTLSEKDWLEAFEHHPKIGDINSLRAKFDHTKDWASNEQSGVDNAHEEVIQRLANGNTQYETKFGYIFIVCATGKTAEEMLAILESRLPNTPEAEIKIAAEEQLKITLLRLQKLSPAI